MRVRFPNMRYISVFLRVDLCTLYTGNMDR